MEIIKQESYNECGICCANMLINFYSKNNKNLKHELLGLCNLTKYGLSILEFEVLCSKYKINIDSYQMSWDELINLKTSRPIVLIIDNNGINHYVIAKIKNKILTVYDPNNLKFKVYSSEQLSNWIGIACLTSCEKISFPTFKINYSIWKNFSFLYTLVFIFLNVLWFLLSFVTSWMLGNFINLNPQNIFQNDLWKLGFIYLTTIIINVAFIQIIKFLKLKIFDKNYKTFCRDYFWEIAHKNIYFFDNFTNEQILQNFNLGLNIINFYCFCWSDIISEIIIFISSITILLVININLLLIIFILLLFSLSTFFYLTKNELDFQATIINNGAKIEKKILSFLEFKSSNINYKKELAFVDDFLIDLNYVNEQKFNNNARKNIWSFVEGIFSHIFNFCLIILLWKSNFNKLGLFFIAFNLFSILGDSTQKIFDTLREFIQVKPIYTELKKIFSISNFVGLDEGANLNLDKIETLTFNNHEFRKNLCINCCDLKDHYLIGSLIKKDDLLDKIKINNLKIKDYTNKDWKNKVIYINDSYKISKLEIKKIVDSLEIPISHELINEQEFISYLAVKSIADFKNKVIIFNNTFKIINHEIIELITHELKKINQTNFLIFNFLPDEMMSVCENFL